MASATATATSTTSSSTRTSRQLRLEFADFVDLQTRLVLLPRIEEEGRGAVVASFAGQVPSPLKQQQQNQHPPKEPQSPTETTSTNATKQSITHQSDSGEQQTGQPVAEPSKEHRDDEEATPSEDGKSTTTETTTALSTNLEQQQQEDDNEEEGGPAIVSGNEEEGDNVMGCILVGVEGPVECSAEEWKEMDFTSILASIRQETTPIVLLLESPDPNTSSSSDLPSSDEATATQTTSNKHSEDDTPIPASNELSQPASQSSTGTIPPPAPAVSVTTNTAADSWSAWGMRMRANTEKLAADAASSAASLSSAVAVAAAEAKERARVAAQKQRQLQQQQEREAQLQQDRKCNVFLQSSLGAYFPVVPPPSAASSTSRSSELKVTTSSLLVVRQSATEPCPPKGFSFQWYRSVSPSIPSLADDASLSSNSAAGSSLSGSISTSGSTRHDIEEVTSAATVEWEVLEGATFAAFQPNATLVGRRLRCIISVETDDSSLDDINVDHVDDDDDLDNADLDSIHLDPQVIMCDLPHPVSADLALFNGSRQALARGAKFGGLVGLGNAKGRTFRLEVALAVCPRRRNKVFGSLAIYQSQGNECVLLSDKPILQVTATADPSHPKRLDLILPATAETVNSMLAALCTDGKFQLEAPNRLTRESFLLTLGIANFRGKPASLNAATILYRDEPLTPRSLSDDCSSSAGSMVSTSLSIHSSVKVVSSSPSNSAPPPPQQATEDTTIAPSSSQVGQHTPEDRMAELEEELRFLRSKLAKKDKVVSELQRQVTQSDAAHEDTKQSLTSSQKDLKQRIKETDELKFALSAASKRLDSNEAKVLQIQGDHALHTSTLEHRIMSQSEKIADLEKANRSLQNEKAVLSAAVEARESKLVRMGELQTSFDKLSQKVAQHDALRIELQETNKRYEEIREDLEQVSQFEKQCREDLEEARKTVDQLTSRLQEHDKKALDGQSQLSELQRKVQVLKAERNSFKQKNDSLSKEMAKLCRNGRTTKDIEKIIADFDAMRDEVEELRKQKRKALEDVHMYRTSYEQTRMAAEQLSSASGSKANNYETRKALERNAELERLLEEMTEYVSAKEMQLETFKQVNAALQEEIHKMARASLGENEV